MTAPLLTVRGLNAFYGDTQVLHGLDFDVTEGGITALLGANGAGKTSTLRALSGMIRATGEIVFGGLSIRGRVTEEIARLGIAHVPEGRGTFSRMTVDENLQLGAMARSDRAAIAADRERLYGYFPESRPTPRPAGRHAVGRRAADAGDRARVDAAAAANPAGRAFVRSCADDRCGGVRDPAQAQRRRRNEHAAGRAERDGGDSACRSRLSSGNRKSGHGRGRDATSAATRTSDALISATDTGNGMDLFLHQVLAGVATGAIYACMALAIVMIYQAIDSLNFAQGEMAMFSTFIAWQLIQWGVPYWPAFFATIAISFVAGVVIERVVFKPLRDASLFSHIVVFIALFAILNSLAGFIWNFTIKSFPSPFSSRPLFGSDLISMHDAGMTLVTLIMLVLLYAFFRYTRIGLAMRATAANPELARLVGIRVGWMVALGWGMAAAIGAVAGMLIAPVVFLEPNMMLSILLYGFAAAVVGGLNSPFGAVIGGFCVGVIENLAGTFIPYVGRELKLTIALALIIAVLTLKPSGFSAEP